MTVIRSKVLMPVLECKNTGSLIPGRALLKYSCWRQVLIVRSAFLRERQHCTRRWYRVFRCMLSSSSLEFSELRGLRSSTSSDKSDLSRRGEQRVCSPVNYRYPAYRGIGRRNHCAGRYRPAAARNGPPDRRAPGRTERKALACRVVD